jgi:hypothetical protein
MSHSLDRPAPPRGWRRTDLLALLAVFALTAAASAAPVRDDKPKDAGLSWLPGDGKLFCSFRMHDVLDSPQGKEVRNGLPKAFTALIDQAEDMAGYYMIDVTYTAEVFDDPLKQDQLSVAEITKPFDIKTMLATLEKNGGKVEERKAGGKTYYAVTNLPGPTDRPMAVAVAAGGVLLSGTEAKVKAALEKGPRKPGGPLAAAIAASRTNQLVVAAVGSVIPADALKQIPDAVRPLTRFQSAVLLGNLGKDGPEFRLSAVFADEDQAKEAVKALEAGRETVAGFLAEGRNKAGDNKPQLKAIDRLAAALKGAEISRTRAAVEVKARVEFSAADFLEFLKQFEDLNKQVEELSK